MCPVGTDSCICICSYFVYCSKSDNGTSASFVSMLLYFIFQVLNGFSDVHIEGVELYDVGQQTDLGRATQIVDV